MIDEVKQAILAVLPDAEVHILDPRNDGVHLLGLVIAAEFAEIPTFKQHQIVMRALKEQFATALHALELKTFAPDEWAQQQDKYPID